MTIRPTETVEPGSPDEELRLLAPGTMLAGRYEVDRPLGTGGYAIVYAAYDHELAQRIAVKVLRSDRVTPATIKRLRREVAVARQIASPRVVRMFDLVHDGELSFLTMELVEGTTLAKELASGPLDLDDALRIAEAVLESLALLHAKGIVHRDLKPANILVTPDRRIKLADFGLARHWDEEAISATATAGVVGTLEYLSPEQALGRSLDARSDLYSFGILLFEMLAGRLPFGSASSLGTVVAHVTAKPPDIRRLRSDVPAWLAVLVRHLLEKSPGQRPANVAAVRAAFRRKSIDWRYRWRKARTAVLTGSLLLAIVAASGAALWHHRESRFASISTDHAGTLRALDHRGRTLWSLPGLRAHIRATSVRALEDETWVVGIPSAKPGDRDATETARPFTVWNAQTGAEIGSIPVPVPPPVFPMPPSFILGGLSPVDVNHDGLEEIVATWVHTPYWPSYTMLVDPRSREANIILYASGHHRFLGSIDLDGDGVDEILLGGPNNSMGWRYGVAAIRLRRGDAGSGNVILPANTPDTVHNDLAGVPLWYALLPRRASYSATIDVVDPASRTFDLVFGDKARERLTFEGFSLAAKSQLPASLRQARRELAYRHLREATEIERRDRPQSAIASLASARQAAWDAKEPELVSWIETVQARMMVRLGRPEPEIESMLEQSGGGAELCWEVATAYGEAGQPAAASRWSLRAIELSNEKGRHPVEYLRLAVVELIESGEPERANRAIDDFIDRSPATRVEAETIRALVLWRLGVAGDGAPAPDPSFPKLSNYWLLELDWSDGVADTEEFLARVRSFIPAGDESVWMRSLEAAVLSSLGRLDEARSVARAAADDVAARGTDPYARVHRDTIEARLQQIENLQR